MIMNTTKTMRDFRQQSMKQHNLRTWPNYSCYQECVSSSFFKLSQAVLPYVALSQSCMTLRTFFRVVSRIERLMSYLA